MMKIDYIRRSTSPEGKAAGPTPAGRAILMNIYLTQNLLAISINIETNPLYKEHTSNKQGL